MRCGYLILFQSNRVGKSDPLDDMIRSMINHVNCNNYFNKTFYLTE
jgi:hypothetical protein